VIVELLTFLGVGDFFLPVQSSFHQIAIACDQFLPKVLCQGKIRVPISAVELFQIKMSHPAMPSQSRYIKIMLTLLLAGLIVSAGRLAQHLLKRCGIRFARNTGIQIPHDAPVAMA
jgi:hypothetical protein